MKFIIKKVCATPVYCISAAPVAIGRGQRCGRRCDREKNRWAKGYQRKGCATLAEKQYFFSNCPFCI